SRRRESLRRSSSSSRRRASLRRSSSSSRRRESLRRSSSSSRRRESLRLSSSSSSSRRRASLRRSSSSSRRLRSRVDNLLSILSKRLVKLSNATAKILPVSVIESVSTVSAVVLFRASFKLDKTVLMPFAIFFFPILGFPEELFSFKVSSSNIEHFGPALPFSTIAT